MNEADLTDVLNDLVDAIHLGNSPRHEIISQYSDYIVRKFRDHILNVMS